jgi:hypothetical protein
MNEAIRRLVEAKGERQMKEGSPPNQIDFDAPATFLKWPSLKGQRREDSDRPYSLLDGTLDECIRQFLAKPTVTRHLYEIHTSAQAPFVGSVVTAANVAELAHLRDFLARASTVLTPDARSTRRARTGRDEQQRTRT